MKPVPCVVCKLYRIVCAPFVDIISNKNTKFVVTLFFMLIGRSLSQLVPRCSSQQASTPHCPSVTSPVPLLI